MYDADVRAAWEQTQYNGVIPKFNYKLQSQVRFRPMSTIITFDSANIVMYHVSILIFFSLGFWKHIQSVWRWSESCECGGGSSAGCDTFLIKCTVTDALGQITGISRLWGSHFNNKRDYCPLYFLLLDTGCFYISSDKLSLTALM